MRKNFFLTRGTLGLALAASVFLGCQDFLGGENVEQTPAPAKEDAQLSAQAVVPPDSAKDMPAQAAEPVKPVVIEPVVTEPVKPVVVEPAKPVVVEPAKPVVIEPVKPVVVEPVKTSPPPTSTLTPEQQQCVALYYELQANNETYMQTKNQYGMQNCDIVLGDAKPAPPPAVPLTTEQLCKMYRSNLITHTPPPEDVKYQAYMAKMEIECAAYP